MQLSLEKNSAENQKSVPFFVRVENQSATLDLSRTLHIPVSTTQIEDTLFYIAEACGYQTRTEDPDKIVPLVGQLIQGLMISNRLPTYVFISRYSRNVHLVYTVGHEVMVFISGGPSFRHVELAKVRQYLGDYLRKTGLLGTPNRPDKLHVRGIHRKTLGLIRPVFYFKRRLGAEIDSFWAPVFLSEEDNHIFAFAASAKRAAPVDDGREVLHLHQIVTEALIADSRLEDPYDLQPDRLFPKHWKQLEATLSPLEETIQLSDKILPVYTKDNLYITADNRIDETGTVEDRYSLFLGRNLAELKRRVAANVTNRR